MRLAVPFGRRAAGFFDGRRRRRARAGDTQMDGRGRPAGGAGSEKTGTSAVWEQMIRADPGEVQKGASYPRQGRGERTHREGLG